jgi:hypothetical protein
VGKLDLLNAKSRWSARLGLFKETARHIAAYNNAALSLEVISSVRNYNDEWNIS